MREIARRQAEEVDACRRSLTTPMGSPNRKPFAPQTAQATGEEFLDPPAPATLAADLELAAERAEVARLRSEVGRWRVAGAAAGVAAPRGSEEEARREEARRRVEQSGWQAERARLEAALADARQRTARLLEGASADPAAARSCTRRPTQKDCRGGVGGAAAARLQQELAVERRATAAACERTLGLRLEVAEERRVAARRRLQEELELLSRRLEAEMELRRVQQEQLAVTEDAVAEVRAQLLEARRTNSELWAALEEHQVLLQRFCG